MQYKDIRKLVVTPPYWCAGDPGDWQCRQGGIAQFAIDGRVGIFNLSWWFLNRTTPPRVISDYRHPGVVWAILQAHSVKVAGRSVEHIAAFHPQHEFETKLRRTNLAAFGDIAPVVQARLRSNP
jgi:hypothetical protein